MTNLRWLFFITRIIFEYEDGYSKIYKRAKKKIEDKEERIRKKMT